MGYVRKTFYQGLVILCQLWAKKTDLQSTGGESSDRVAVNQKAIRINDEQYWLYTAVDPRTNMILNSRMFSTYIISVTREFFTTLAEKYDVKDTTFLIETLTV